MGRLAIIAAAVLSLIVSAAGSNAEPGEPSGAGSDPQKAASPAPKPGGAAPEGHAVIMPPSGPPIVVQANNGTLVRLSGPANTVFVANSNVADVTIKTPELIYVAAKTPGETTLYAVDAQDHVLLNKLVRVVPNEEPMHAALQQLKALGVSDNVDARWLNSTLILGGTVANARRAELIRAAATAVAGTVPGSTVLDRLSIATPNQVNIRVRIAEVDRTVLKRLGINLSRIGRAISFSTGAEIPNPGTALTANLLGGPVGANLTGTLDLLATDGLAKTLAEPNLTVENNQTASFISGGTIYITGASSAPAAGAVVIATTSQILPVNFGTQLYVTPTIIDAAHLTLRINPVFSSVGPPSPTGNTTINQQSAQTTVELGSGETFALAGLIQETATETINKIPGLGDIPWLGQLFRNQTTNTAEKELVILVTPYLVEPSTTALAAPTDGMQLPHDVSQVMTGATYRQTLPGPPRGPVGPGDERPVGLVGFRLD
jgi:pilus assembly protein CpaC